MKRIVSIILATALALGICVPASAATIGDEKYNIYSDNYYNLSYDMYLDYLKTLREQRGTLYSAEELGEVYDTISYYIANRNNIETNSKALEVLLNGLMFVGIRADETYNCVEVIAKDMSPKAAEIFSEYICDSDAVVLWNVSYNAAPTYNEDLDVKPSQKLKAPIKLKPGATYSIPIANKSKVQLWKSTDAKVASVSGGKITARKKGSASITAVYGTAVEVSFGCDVTASPKLTVGGKKVTSISVKKGKTKSVKLSGKAAAISNVYTNTKKAKFTSAKSASLLKVKGLKKGTTTLKVKVNNSVTLKLKVRVMS